MDNNEIYILNSKRNINKYLYNYDYRKAFGLLILVLERLDDNLKNELIDYYSKYLLIKNGL